MEPSDTVYKLPHTSDMATTIGCLLVAYFIGRKVGRSQTVKMFKSLNNCSCTH